MIKDLLEEGQLTNEDLKRIKKLLELNETTMEQAKRAYDFRKENQHNIDIAVTIAAAISSVLA